MIKKAGVVVLSIMCLAACNNSATVENKADTSGRQADTVSRQKWDSGKQDVKELRDRVENQFEDSTSK